MRYYIFDESQPNGFVEVTKEEYAALFGDKTTRPYVSAVYCGEIQIEEVPTELQTAVQSLVNNRIDRWGLYENQDTGTIEDYPDICG